ncbi:penicillin-binding protein [Gemella massiliensis]|uniref:penicillin-binding protein n=1 Tax=Gemella massiliensis TaxID=1909670 RepID=UPI000931CCB5|nr:penicillin-binding protein [Gemella massiliensis]
MKKNSKKKSVISLFIDRESLERKDHISRGRTKIVFLFIFVFFFVWVVIINIGQMMLIGSVRGHNLMELADKKYKIDTNLQPNRGKIYDRNGNILADNIESYKLVAVVSDKATEDNNDPHHVVDVDKTAEELAKFIKLDKSKIKEILEKKGVYQVEFGSQGKDISVENKKKIEELKLPGIQFIATTKRYYPNGSMLGNFLGFAQNSPDSDLITGRLGVEKTFDYYLRGKEGHITYAKDAWGKVVSNIPKVEIKPVDGADIHLTIDKNIQSYIDNSLKDIQEKYKPESAFAIAVSAKTGEILGLGQSPAFNPNTQENLEHAWANIFYNSAYEPGSTLKTFTMSIMVENNLYNPNSYYKSGSYKVEDATIYDWNKTGWGTITHRHGFQQSSNTLMLTLLQGLGTEKLKTGLENFGFGKSTNSLFNNEASGDLVFNNKVSASTTVFGQGSTVTAMQMIQAETAILNDGQMLAPYFLQKIHDKTINKDVNIGGKKIVGTPISKSTADTMKEKLYGVVNGQWAQGGRRYQVDNYSISGKTGTAEVVDPKTGTYYKSPYKVFHSFLGYAPSENPEVILYVGMKVPTKNLGESNAKAVSELFKPIMENTLNYLDVKKNSEEKMEEKFTMDNYENSNVNAAITGLSAKTKNVITIGEGTTVTRQYPSKGNIFKKDDKVFLVLSTENIKLPNFKGWSKTDVLAYAKLAGLNIEVEGNGYATSQNIQAQKIVTKNEKIKVKFS